MREVAWEELVRLLIRGATISQCVNKLGFSRHTIDLWIRKPEFQTLMTRTRRLVFQKSRDVAEEVVEEVASEVREDLQSRLETYAKAAIEKMFNLMMTAQAETVQLRAAESLADRSPATQKTKKVDVGASIMVTTPELMAVAMATAEELKTDHQLGRHIAPIPLDPSMAEPVSDDSEEPPIEIEVELEDPSH